MLSLTIKYNEVSKTEFTNTLVSGHLRLHGVSVPHWGAAAFGCPGGLRQAGPAPVE